MTAHSGRGQGDQPLYEGVVLPANGDPWTPEQQRQVDEAQRQPTAGQPWGEPWGPQSQAAVTSGEHSGSPLPPPPQTPPAMPGQQPPAAMPPQQHSLPGTTEEAGADRGGRLGGGDSTPPPAPHSQGQPPASVQPETAAGAPLPAAQPGEGPYAPYAPHAPQTPQPQAGQAWYGNGQLPPQSPQPAQQPPAAQQFASAAPAADASADATQYIPPVTGGAPLPGEYQHGQYQPGQAPPVADAEATQMLPPQTGGPPAADPESTAQLRSPLPPEAPAGGQGGHGGPAQQPQPQPPAGFESLFRSEPGAAPGSGEPGATQSLPLFDGAVARQRRGGGVGGLGKSGGQPGPAGPSGPYGQGPGYGQAHGQVPGQGAQNGQWEPPQGRAARRNAERSAISRMSPGILIGVGVAVVAGVGMVAGAALSGGDKDDRKSGSKSSAAPASEKSEGPDPAEAQAKELDKLLADSNNSRATVIRSVENIKSCKKLKQAASDLRAAAGQRNSLVTRLGKVETGDIPANAQLKSSLTRAWKSSASADSHYATWADQTAGKKGCRKGKARTTTHTGLGARSSGEATAAKKQAAKLWNPTAKKYGLQQRQVGEL
ncbi:hypothetical protein [Streptomyces abyssalis]|uniref:Uncharacterized protein n=1 Tax=Streptomyces abyssalis TaxID=933944 RepID=A0A1E7JNJ3_9ACTN|nr:hypothetical protein [Streptomyces abyssalis]OEU89815.1 hypothetical protein AN215_09010 [Streptomyces abyssalis]